MYAHLHNHFLVDSSAKITDAVSKAAADNQPAMAITDHNLIALHLKFYDECIKKGIKPILGCECYFTESFHNSDNPRNLDKYHLIVLAKNKIGLSNLYKMLDFSRNNYSIKERVSLVDWNLLERFKEGLIVTNACVYGNLAQKIIKKKNYLEDAGRFISIFGNDFYFELGYHYFPDQRYANAEIIKIAEKFGKTPILNNDCHYVNQEDWYIHNIIFNKTFAFKNSPATEETQDSFFKTEAEMLALGYDPEYMSETCRLAERVEIFNPRDILTENYRPDKNNFFLNGKLFTVLASNSVLWAAEYFKINADDLKIITKNIDDNLSLNENYTNNSGLRSFLDDNPLVAEAAYKLEGIVTDIQPDFENVILRNETMPSMFFAGAALFSQFDYSDEKHKVSLLSIEEFPDHKKKIERISILCSGIKLYENDDFSEAVDVLYAIATDLEFGNTANFFIANSFFFMNKYSDADNYYRKISEEKLDQERKYWYNYFRAIIDYKYRKNSESAINYLTKAMVINSAKANAYHYIGLIYNDLRNYPLAKNYLKKFIELARSKENDKIERVKKILAKIENFQEQQS